MASSLALSAWSESSTSILTCLSASVSLSASSVTSESPKATKASSYFSSNSVENIVSVAELKKRTFFVRELFKLVEMSLLRRLRSTKRSRVRDKWVFSFLVKLDSGVALASERTSSG